MQYVVVIEPAAPENPDFCVLIPDLPGCFAQGATLEEALTDAEASAELWLEVWFRDERDAPKASTEEDLRAQHPEWADWLWSRIAVDVSNIRR